jgi:hypothetical protein
VLPRISLSIFENRLFHASVIATTQPNITCEPFCKIYCSINEDYKRRKTFPFEDAIKEEEIALKNRAKNPMEVSSKRQGIITRYFKQKRLNIILAS